MTDSVLNLCQRDAALAVVSQEVKILVTTFLDGKGGERKHWTGAATWIRAVQRIGVLSLLLKDYPWWLVYIVQRPMF